MNLGMNGNGRWEQWNTRIRDIVLFVIGVAGIINELFLIAEPRPSSLVFLGSLVGLPFVLNADERRRRSGKDSKDE